MAPRPHSHIPAQPPSTTLEHPHDGFSALRFSILFPSPPVTADPGHIGHEHTLQGIELCFHRPFVPDPDSPLSVHFNGRDEQPTLLSGTTTLSTPTPPCYIIEYNPIAICCPSTLDAVQKNDGHRESERKSLEGGNERSQGLEGPGVRGRRYVLLLLIPVLSCIFLAVYYLCLAPRPPESLGGQLFVEAQHDTVTIGVLEELLSITEHWAAIPRTILDADKVLNWSDGLGSADAPLAARSSRLSPLDEVNELVNTIILGIVRTAPPNQADAMRLCGEVFAAEIAQSVRDIAGIWDADLESKAGFRWIPAVLLGLPFLRDRLRNAVVPAADGDRDEIDDDDDDAAAALFFSSSPASFPFNPLKRRLDIVTGDDGNDGDANRIAVFHMPDAVRHVLDAYDFMHKDMGGEYCSFFQLCQSGGEAHDMHSHLQYLAPHRFHPICQMLPQPGAPGDVRALVGFLEQWRDVDREGGEAIFIPDHDDRGPLANASHGTSHGRRRRRDFFARDGNPYEPDIMAVALYTATMASDIDAFLALTRTWGFWDPLAGGPPSPPPTLWERRMGGGGASKRKEHAARAELHRAASRLAALRASAILDREVAAVAAVMEVRDACTRLSAVSSTVRDLRRGLGWASMSFIDEAAGSFPTAIHDGRVYLRSLPRVLLTHGLLPCPRAQADMVEESRMRIEAVGRDVSAGLQRLRAAEGRLHAAVSASASAPRGARDAITPTVTTSAGVPLR